MFDEKKLSREKEWFYEVLPKKVVGRLEKNNIHAEYVRDRKEALKKIMKNIPKDATVGFGDSVTLHQIGLFSHLEGELERVLFNPFARDSKGHFLYEPEVRFELMRKALTSDVFLSSSNAVTLDGKLVNVDGRGNRVAAMIFGPKKIILVVGANKIVKDVEEALRRVKSWCTPINLKRHSLKHHNEFFEKLPCLSGGVCMDCESPLKVCRKIVIIDGQIKLPGSYGPSLNSEMLVIMVGEELGI